MTDYVNHPSHYATGDVECIDAIKSAMGAELFCGYLWGNAMKYLWRWARKSLDEDLEKCKWYIDRLQSEGYAEPATYDADSGSYVPNPVLDLLNYGGDGGYPEWLVGSHARFTC